MKIFAILIAGLIFSTSAGANPTTSASPAVAKADSTPAPLTAAEKKKLLSEFQKALTDQRGALAHQEKSAFKELSATQKFKQRKWREEQKTARHQFFDQHMSGPERREYVQAYLKKKEEFDAGIKAEYLAAKKTWMEKSIALRTMQKDLEGKFNASLAQGVRPPVDLWPVSN